jgi:UDP-N-acetyl-D-mannosaminuronic acid transferase (WecB/TagA/CpsF family)
MRVKLLGLPVDILSYDETIERILAAIARGQRCQHVALNVAKLINARTDAELDRDIRTSDIVGVDGMGIVYALRLLGHPISERVAGVDLFESLMAECAAYGLRPYLLGALPKCWRRPNSNCRRDTRTWSSPAAITAISQPNRKSPSASSFAPAVRIACSSPCRRRAKSALWLAIVTV